MTAVARVRLPTESGSAAGATSRTRTLSRTGSEYDNNNPNPYDITNYEATPKASTAQNMGGSRTQYDEVAIEGSEDLRTLVARLEEMQLSQRSVQQPNPELDLLLNAALASRPEWRQRMAVMTKSALLRKKILMAVPPGGRAVGSAQLGASHPWRSPKLMDTYTDHNWPKAQTGKHGLHELPGGTQEHAPLLRQPADKIPMNPLISHSQNYSIPRAKRFHGTKDNGEVDKFECQKRGNPGPGAYLKSIPRGPAFSVDGGETYVVGANHIYPWKKPLGQQINPIGTDAAHVHTQPCYSFPKTRRSVAQTSWGSGCQDGGPVKSDAGCLSPGHVYTHYGTMRPKTTRTLGFRTRHAKSAPNLPRVRMVRMEPEEAPPEDENPIATIVDIEDSPP